MSTSMGTPIDGAGGGGFGATGRGRTGGSFTADKGGGWVEMVLGDAVMGDQREFDLETRVTTNGNNKTPRCFTVVH